MLNINKPLFLNIVLLITYLLTIPLAFRVSGFNFIIELFALAFSVIIATIAMVSLYRHKQWGYPVLFLIFGFLALNPFFLYHNISSSFYMLILISIISLAGFYSSLFGINKDQELRCPEYESTIEQHIKEEPDKSLQIYSLPEKKAKEAKATKKKAKKKTTKKRPKKKTTKKKPKKKKR